MDNSSPTLAELCVQASNSWVMNISLIFAFICGFIFVSKFKTDTKKKIRKVAKMDDYDDRDENYNGSMSQEELYDQIS
jgi:hypothetical protein